MSRYRDPQPQVGENYSHLFNLGPLDNTMYYPPDPPLCIRPCDNTMCVTAPTGRDVMVHKNGSPAQGYEIGFTAFEVGE